VSSLYQYIIEKTVSGGMDQEIGVEILKQLKQEDQAKSRKDIAIIGMAVEMSNAADLDQFWGNLRQGIDCVKPFPDSRKADLDALWRAGQLADSVPEFVEGAYLDNIARFDPAFFNISPMEAKLMDPQQRLFLQLAWKAMTDAGYGGRQLSKSRTGVYVGFSSDFSEAYQELIAAINPDQLPFSVTGNIASIIASRISYCLNLRGPAMLVDTACSSGLVAVHLAALGLRNGDCEAAIVGGVKLNMLPRTHPLGIASSTSRTRSFDEGSDGTGFGEGVVAIMLKPLEQARKDGDRIYAVVKGSAVNQDGSSSGISAPNALAQEDLLVRAWKDAGINPDTLRHMEAHGTGTKLGDPIEMDGISKAFARFTDKKQFCAISSVKSNLGHLDHLAGLAGLVKSVLAMHHGEIPPSLHFQRPNRNIPFENSPMFVNDRLIPWIAEETPRRCGVSSFGLSGTNCHVVLEEGPPLKEQEKEADDSEHLHLLTLSAKSKEALRELVQTYRFWLGRAQGRDLADLCYTANTGRGQYRCRLALLFTSIDELRAQLIRLAQTEDWRHLADAGVSYGEYRIVSAQKNDRQVDELTEDDKRRLAAQAAPLLADGGRLADLVRLFAAGADVDWSAHYRNQPRRKVELPPDPFMQKRFWVEAAANQQSVESALPANAKPINALIDRQLAGTMNLRIYASDFHYDKRWVLSEHRIGGNGVVPGTAYLDMLRQISLLLYPGQECLFEQIMFLAPLIVSEGEARQVHLLVEDEGEARRRFTVISRSEEEDDWVKHCEGGFSPIDPPMSRTLPLRELLDQFAECDPIVNQEQSQGEVQFGPRWHNVRQIRVSGKNVLARIALPDDYAADIPEHELHPALMDNAMNIAINHIGEGLYLPWMYQKLRVHRSMPAQLYSLISLKQEFRPDAETAVFDVVLFDDEGYVIAEAEDYVIKRVNKHGASYQRLKAADSYQITWVPEPFASAQPVEKPQGSALVISNDSLSAVSFVEQFKQAGYRAVGIELDNEFREIAPDRLAVSVGNRDFDRIWQFVAPQHIVQIVYMLQAPKGGADDYGQLEALLKNSVEGLFTLIQSLISNKASQTLDLILIAPNAQCISGQESELQPLFSAFFGLGKVIREEYPNLRVRCIDHDEATSAATLWKEIEAEPTLYCTGYRGDVRYVPQLSPLELVQPDAGPLELNTDGFYLLTGGLGGLGLEIGKHLASLRSGIKLAFMNRNALPPREEWARVAAGSGNGRTERAIKALLEMERHGAAVRCVAADVSKPDDLERAFRELRAQFGRVNGVVHAAGVAGKGYLFNKELGDFRNVLAPKIEGTWLLDKQIEEDRPDFFVLFSSFTSIVGGVGQGDYTAANAYLETFAAERSRRGKRTISINWPAWKETGMAVDHQVKDNGILQAIRTSSALHALDQLLTSGHSQVIVGKLNGEAASVLSDSFQFILEPELARRIARMSAGRRPRLQQPEPVFAEVEMHGKAAFTETEFKLAQIWAGVMELEQINVYDDFYSLGGDSIIAVKIVSNMADRLNLVIGVTELLDHATIEALAKYVDQQAGREPEIRRISSVPAPVPVKSAEEPKEEEHVRKTAEVAVALPERANINLSAYEWVQDLSWRQLNCYDRGFAILLGNGNDAFLVSFFKLFLGLKRGYDLSKHGYPYELGRQEQKIGYVEYVTDRQILAKFGGEVRPIHTAHAAQLHDTICWLVERNNAVMVAFDEYYTFYTPFYQKEHTTHLTIIHGYDRRNQTYAIINHNHLRLKANSPVSYGTFATPFATVEEIYGDLPEPSRIVISLERVPDTVVSEQSLRNELLDLLRHVMREEQAGSDFEFMANWDTFRTDSEDHKIKELYVMLGGKELFVDTLVRDFLTETQRETGRKAAASIAHSSAQLVNKFTTGIIRNRFVTTEELETIRLDVRRSTLQLLDMAIQALEQDVERHDR